MKTFRFKRVGRRSGIALPSRPSPARSEQEEPLSGMVQGKEASAPEENLARALQKKGVSFIFRYVVGAPKGLPGWKEVDFLVFKNGIVYPVEVDTAFTHRSKVQKDKLHDAIILNDEELKKVGTLWNEVIHVDGDTEIASAKSAIQFVERRF